MIMNMSYQRDQQVLHELFAAASRDAPENAINFVFCQVVHRYKGEVDHALEPLDLTFEQFTTLTLVAWFKNSVDPVTQTELSQVDGINPGQLSRTLQLLETKLLISHAVGSPDMQANRFTLTESGLTLMRNALPIVIKVQRRLFGEKGSRAAQALEGLLHVHRPSA
jgi:DNA-binding MarR family transcriptional regulator